MVEKRKHRTAQPLILGTVALVGIIVVGCSPRNNTALERARASYVGAEQNPQITTYAPVALREAQQTLQQAEQVWEQEHDSNEVVHLAYVTEQQVEIARATTDKAVAEAEIQQLSEERERVLLEARTRETQRAAARTRQLEQELAELKAKQTERGLVLTLDDVLFEYNKADLKSGAMRNLYPLVTFLKENPARNVIIEGHTDSLGSDSYNLELSRRRAETVQGFLLQNGIAPERVTAHGYGESYPVASNGTEAGRQQNRRVDVVILREGELATGRMR